MNACVKRTLIYVFNFVLRGAVTRRGRDHIVVGLITTYEISDMLHVSDFLRALRLPPPIKLTATM